MGFMRGHKNISFQSSIKSIFQSDLEKTNIAIAELNAKATKVGAYSGSRRWLGVQTKMIEGITTYKSSLLGALNKHDPEHSSVRINDFELAKSSLEEFRASLEKQYHKKIEAAAAFGQGSAFNHVRFDRELDKAIAEIEQSKLFFKSKRSFWKRIRRKVEDKILGLAIAFFLGLFSKEFLEKIISIMKDFRF